MVLEIVVLEEGLMNKEAQIRDEAQEHRRIVNQLLKELDDARLAKARMANRAGAAEKLVESLRLSLAKSQDDVRVLEAKLLGTQWQ
jgi:hypothetical protein